MNYAACEHAEEKKEHAVCVGAAANNEQTMTEKLKRMNEVANEMLLISRNLYLYLFGNNCSKENGKENKIECFNDEIDFLEGNIIETMVCLQEVCRRIGIY